MGKEELIGLLQTEDSADAGIALSFAEDVPTGDIRFQRQFAGVKAAVAYWLEQKKKTEGDKPTGAALRGDLELAVQQLQREMMQMKYARTWSPTAVKTVGKNVLAEIPVVPPNVRALLGDAAIDSASEAAMLSCIERHFKQLQSLGAKNNKEGPVQEGWRMLFEELLAIIASGPSMPSFQVHDTSVKDYLTSPTAKADFTFTINGQMHWSSAVWFAEAKASLLPTDARNEVLGQLSERVQHLLTLQPQRRFAIAMALGPTSMEVLCFPRVPGIDPLWRTDLQSLKLDGPAAQFLLRLFTAGAGVFGYQAPVVPAPFPISVGGQSCVLSSFECLRAPSSDSSALATAFLSQLPDGQPIVVKLGDKGSLAYEEAMLGRLRRTKLKVPRVLASGSLPDGTAYMAIQPVGRHLGAYDPPEVIAQVMLDAATTIVELHKLSVLHCDISSNNLLVTPDGRGMLIDFGSALEVKADAPEQRLGTIMFSATSVLWGRPNSVSSDLESLFYTLLYVILDGEIPGCQELSAARIAAYRLGAMLDERKFQPLLQRAWGSHPSLLPLQPLVEQLHKLFFEASGARFTYNAAAAPEAFVRVCEEQLTALRTQPSPPPPASPSQSSAPADGSGMITNALPVRTSGSSTLSHPLRRNQGQRTLPQPVRRSAALLPCRIPSVRMLPPLSASLRPCFVSK